MHQPLILTLSSSEDGEVGHVIGISIKPAKSSIGLHVFSCWKHLHPSQSRHLVLTLADLCCCIWTFISRHSRAGFVEIYPDETWMGEIKKTEGQDGEEEIFGVAMAVLGFRRWQNRGNRKATGQSYAVTNSK